jgi:hypothetical protein
MRFQRAYIAEHPVVFWLSLGIALAGTIALIAPQLAEQSTASLLLPGWLLVVFNITYAVGGWGSFIGIGIGLRKLEAGGMALLASGLLTNFIVFVYVTQAGAPGAAFLLTLAIGCGQRSWHLTTAAPAKIEP